MEEDFEESCRGLYFLQARIEQRRGKAARRFMPTLCKDDF